MLPVGKVQPTSGTGSVWGKGGGTKPTSKVGDVSLGAVTGTVPPQPAPAKTPIATVKTKSTGLGLPSDSELRDDVSRMHETARHETPEHRREELRSLVEPTSSLSVPPASKPATLSFADKLRKPVVELTSQDGSLPTAKPATLSFADKLRKPVVEPTSQDGSSSSIKPTSKPLVITDRVPAAKSAAPTPVISIDKTALGFMGLTFAVSGVSGRLDGEYQTSETARRGKDLTVFVKDASSDKRGQPHITVANDNFHITIQGTDMRYFFDLSGNPQRTDYPKEIIDAGRQIYQSLKRFIG